MAVHHPGDLNQEVGRIQRRERQLAKQSPLASSSVTRGRVRVASKEGLLAESVPGGEPAISVVGRQSVSGRLDGDGVLFWDGDAEFTKDTKVGGNFEVDAETIFRGLVEMFADLIVKTGGEILVEGSNPIRLAQSGADAVISLGSAILQGIAGAGVSLTTPNGAVTITSSSATLQGGSGVSQVIVGTGGATLQGGTRSIRVTSGSIIASLPTRSSSAAGGAIVGTVWSDTNGNLFRVIA